MQDNNTCLSEVYSIRAFINHVVDQRRAVRWNSLRSAHWYVDSLSTSSNHQHSSGPAAHQPGRHERVQGRKGCDSGEVLAIDRKWAGHVPFNRRHVFVLELYSLVT